MSLDWRGLQMSMATALGSSFRLLMHKLLLEDREGKALCVWGPRRGKKGFLCGSPSPLLYFPLPYSHSLFSFSVPNSTLSLSRAKKSFLWESFSMHCKIYQKKRFFLYFKNDIEWGKWIKSTQEKRGFGLCKKIPCRWLYSCRSFRPLKWRKGFFCPLRAVSCSFEKVSCTTRHMIALFSFRP